MSQDKLNESSSLLDEDGQPNVAEPPSPVPNGGHGAGLHGPKKAVEPAATAEHKCWKMLGGKSGALTALYCLLLLISSVGNSIFFKRMSSAMPNYPYFLSQVTTVVYLPFFFGLVAYELAFTNLITPEMRAFPKSKFFAMGAFDAVSGVFMLFGGVHTSGSTQALLMNAVIPVTMFLSVVVLKTKFKFAQYAGAAIILAGVGVVLLPQFLFAHPGASSDDNIPLFNIIFLGAVLPSALSSVYKEVAFQDNDIDVNWLQAWVAFWQTVFGLVLIPLNTLSILGDNSLPWNQLGDALVDGYRCLTGTNTIVAPNCFAPGQPHPPGIKPCDSCNYAWVSVVVYLVFNLNFNVFVVLVIKHGGAALMYVIMTLRLPLVQLAFALPFINNPPDPFEWPSGVGLAIILCGLIMYRWSSVQRRADSGMEDLVVGGIGQIEFPPTIRRKIMLHLRRDAAQIRSSLYSRLGVINSPITPHSPRRSPASGRGSPAVGAGGRGSKAGAGSGSPLASARSSRVKEKSSRGAVGVAGSSSSDTVAVTVNS